MHPILIGSKDFFLNYYYYYTLPTIYVSSIIHHFYGHAAHSGGEAQHVTHPALGPGRVFVWVTWLALCSVSVKIKPGALLKRLRGGQRLRQGALLPSTAVTPAQSAQAVQL